MSLLLKLQGISQAIHHIIDSVQDYQTVFQQFGDGDMFNMMFDRGILANGGDINIPW